MIFDLDGTLLDTLQDLAAAGNRVCAGYGWPQHTLAEYRYFVGNGISRLVERFTPPEQRTPAILAAARAAFGAEYAAHMQEKTAPYPGIRAMLLRLAQAGVQMAVLSNKDDALAGRIVQSYFGPGLFAAIHGAGPQTPPKPDPHGVLALMRALAARPGSTLLVGDSDVDVLTARNAGLPCCGVLWGFRGEAELTAAGAAYLARDAGELAQCVLRGPARDAQKGGNTEHGKAV